MGKREHIYEIIAENIRKERRRLGICKVLHENVKGLQFPKTHNNF